MALKKGLSELHIIGDIHKKKVLLVHGMGFQWEYCFGKVIEKLRGDYCLVVPELGGHNMQGTGGFTNVYECAEEIIEFIQKKGIKEIEWAYGISLGASIAMEIALKNYIKINNLILDGGQYESMGFFKKIYAYVMAKEFQRVIQNRRMWTYVSKQMGYKNGNEKDILFPLCNKKIQFHTLYETALAAYGYDIKRENRKLHMKVIIMYGENEKFATKSVPIVKNKCFSECEVIAFKEMGHSEALSLYPKKICEVIQK